MTGELRARNHHYHEITKSGPRPSMAPVVLTFFGADRARQRPKEAMTSQVKLHAPGRTRTSGPASTMVHGIEPSRALYTCCAFRFHVDRSITRLTTKNRTILNAGELRWHACTATSAELLRWQPHGNPPMQACTAVPGRVVHQIPSTLLFLLLSPSDVRSTTVLYFSFWMKGPYCTYTP